MSTTETITTESEAAAAQAATIRERKKRRQKQQLANAELDIIINDLHKELQQLNFKKKEVISNAAEKMASILPIADIAKTLVQSLKELRFRVDRSYIYHICTELWPEVYNSSVSGDGDLSNIRQIDIDEDKSTEQDAKNLVANGTVTKEEIEKGPATMDFYHDFYNESEIELDSDILYDLQIAMRNYPDKIIITQQKGKAVDIPKIIGNSKEAEGQ